MRLVRTTTMTVILFERRFPRSPIAGAALLACLQLANAQTAPSPAPSPTSSTELPAIRIIGNYDNAVGTSDAASQGAVTSKLIQNRPILRPAELLEFVPGVIVTQHSGDGKANQYFLRGFNLDHGTDFATFVDGMPVNMPSHAHGQGYSDMNWLMPELVSRIDYRKGPYYASEGDFSSAGSARIGLFNELPRGIASISLGQNGYQRAVIANSVALTTGTLLYAIEGAHNDGPWINPERFQRLNGVLRYSLGTEGNRSSLTAMAYSASWNSTDQIPKRAVDSGLIGRYATIDPTDGGETTRYSLSFDTERSYRDGKFKLNAFAIQSSLDLYSNFTYNLDNPSPPNADQFEQSEHRRVFGIGASRSFDQSIAGLDTVNTLGVQVRHDRLSPVGLYSSLARQRVATTQEAQVRETSLGLYAENAVQWLPWFRSVAGVRHDRFNFDVDSSIAANTGTKSAAITNPKLSLVFGPWSKTEYFVNLGYGFHSNDARGVTSTISPREGTPIDPSPGLVRTKGAEIGVRTEIIPGLQSSLALWQLNVGSELVFSGDAGDTEASGASKRHGIELNNHYVAAPWLLFDADVAVSKSRFRADQGDAGTSGRYIPGSVQTVVALGATVTDYGPWFGQFQVRYFGPRPLIEDNSQRSKATTLAYLRMGYKITKDIKLAVDVFNLFDRKSSDIDYFYASRLPGEPPAGVDDIHFHPTEPRTLRMTLSMAF
ncbi:TonB-dependent receptor [soil metagenome]